MSTADSTSPATRRRGGRHKSRRRAVDILFEAEARSLDARQLIDERRVAARENDGVQTVNDYAETLIRGASDQRSEIDDLIATHLEGWTLDRLPDVDRAILRVGVWELLYSTDVPAAVAVTEGVDLAEELSTDDSPKFINAILDNISDVAQRRRRASAQLAATNRTGRA